MTIDQLGEAHPEEPPNSPEWKPIALGQVSEIRFSSVDKLSSSSEEPVRLCNYTDVYNHDYITESLLFMKASASSAEIQRFRLELGDVLITKDSETPSDIGIPAVVDYAAPDLVCGYHLGLIRPHASKADPVFLAKQLAHHRLAKYFGRQANGLTRYGLPLGAMQKALLWLPGITEQRNVGTLFRLTDQAIEAFRATFNKLKHVYIGLLHDLLTRGIDENGELRDPVAHPDQFQETCLGLFPRTWDILTLGDFFDLQTGATPPRQQEKRFFVDGTIPWIKTLDLNEGWIRATEERITQDALEETSCKLLPINTVLVAMYGGWEQIGRTAITGLPAATNQAICALVGRQDRVHPEYLLRALQFHRRRWRRVAASTRKDPNITKEDVARFPVPVPVCPSEQRGICEKLSAAASRIEVESASLQKLISLKDGLNSDLVTGRVLFPESMQSVEALA